MKESNEQVVDSSRSAPAVPYADKRRRFLVRVTLFRGPKVLGRDIYITLVRHQVKWLNIGSARLVILLLDNPIGKQQKEWLVLVFATSHILHQEPNMVSGIRRIGD